ncbi:hypothetical protein OESDEN_21687, partial [Oesophagostomum dentatum]
SFRRIQACTPAAPALPGIAPAQVTLFTDQPYDANKATFYSTFTKNQITDAIKKNNLPYDPSSITVKPRDVNGKVAVDLEIPNVDCLLLTTMVSQMKSQNFLITSAGIRCGLLPTVTYV